MFKKLAQQIKAINVNSSYLPVSKPFNAQKYDANKSFLDRLSKHALEEYEKKMTIKKFTKLTLSDPEDFSHNDIVDKLFRSGNAVDIASKSNIKSLSANPKILKDLGL